MEKGNQGIKWSSLIMGVLLLMLAVVIFTFPIENFYAITWLIGLFVLINGVIQIVYRRKAKALVGGKPKLDSVYRDCRYSIWSYCHF